MRVAVYFNLNTQLWSVCELKSPRCFGRVLFHAKTVSLDGATFVAREGGRQSVIRKRCRSVHAFVTGELVERDAVRDGVACSYNPYKRAHFYHCSDLDHSVESAGRADFCEDRKVYLS